jgi:hypothetical protein
VKNEHQSSSDIVRHAIKTRLRGGYGGISFYAKVTDDNGFEIHSSKITMSTTNRFWNMNPLETFSELAEWFPNHRISLTLDGSNATFVLDDHGIFRPDRS